MQMERNEPAAHYTKLHHHARNLYTQFSKASLSSEYVRFTNLDNYAI